MKNENQFLKVFNKISFSRIIILCLSLSVLDHSIRYFGIIKPQEELSLKDWVITIVTATIVGLCGYFYEKRRRVKLNK
jgi:hypothetical protein